MGIFALETAREWGIMAGLGLGVYAFFMLLGFGFSAASTFQKCEKVDAAKNAKYGAIWAVYPAVAWYIIRIFEVVRIHFDRFYLSLDSTTGGSERAGWISIGYFVTLACVVGMYGLVADSNRDVCIPTADEATRFKQNMIAAKAAKDAAVKSAQESTPAVKPVVSSGQTSKTQ
jgi:hypothetical protein